MTFKKLFSRLRYIECCFIVNVFVIFRKSIQQKIHSVFLQRKVKDALTIRFRQIILMQELYFEQCFITDCHYFALMLLKFVSISSMSGTSRITRASLISTSRSLYITNGICFPPNVPHRWLICSNVNVYNSAVTRSFKTSSVTLVRSTGPDAVANEN